MLLESYIIVVFLTSEVTSSLLEKLHKHEVLEIKMRLEEEKAKRLLLQNDVEMLMLKTEQMERECKKETGSMANTPKNGSKISFSARLSTTTSLDMHHLIKFDQVLHNQGKGYSPNTGIFRAPETGTYVFALALLSPAKGVHFHVSIMLNKTEIGRVFSGSDASNWGDQGSVTVVTSLIENDEVFVWEYASSGQVHGDFYCTFSGFKLYD